mgnify:CR=1 FL=1
MSTTFRRTRIALLATAAALPLVAGGTGHVVAQGHGGRRMRPCSSIGPSDSLSSRAAAS